MCSKQAFEESLSRCPITARLQKHINNFTILINSPPQIVLLAINLHKDFIYVECVAVAFVSALQSSGIVPAKLDAP